MASPHRSQSCPPSVSKSILASPQLTLAEWPLPELRPSRSSPSSSLRPLVPEKSSSEDEASGSASLSSAQPDSEWPFAALRLRRSLSASSRSSSSWPFVRERPPSPSSLASSSSDETFIYQPLPAKEWAGVYPPVLPPPDMFDAEILEKWIRENMFKKDNARDNYLYDETGKVTLPVDEKGILILDPVSRTRIIDVRMEEYIWGEYEDWIGSVIDEAKELGAKQSEGWLRGLRAEVKKDYDIVDKEWKIVVNEERKQRCLTDWKAHVDWWDSTGHKL